MLNLAGAGHEVLIYLNIWHKHEIIREPKDIYNIHDNNDVNDID